MTKSNKNILKVLIFAASFATMSVAYQNCGNFDSGGSGEASAATAASGNGDIIPLPNTKTASVVRASRVVDNLVACLGTGTASTDVNNALNRNRASISEEGLANSVTQPMIKSFVDIAAEVCEDLMNAERAMAAGDRRIFNEINFDAGDLTAAAIANGARRLARSCWGRNATSEELDMITSAVGNSFNGSPNNSTTTRQQIVYMCTAMAASFSTYEM